MNKEQYKLYLNSPAWKKLREKAMKRANHNCELCTSYATQVHHISYPKNLSEDKLDNLLVCCDSCHQKQHGIRDGGESLLRKTIIKRINFRMGITEHDMGFHEMYDGFDMSLTHDEPWRTGLSERKKHFELFNRFKDYMPNNFKENDFKLFFWKGMGWWGDENFNNNEKEFGGWTTEDIIFWIIRNYGKYRKEENSEAFEKMFKEYADKADNFLGICYDCSEEFKPGEQIFNMGGEDSATVICSKCAGVKLEVDGDGSGI